MLYGSIRLGELTWSKETEMEKFPEEVIFRLRLEGSVHVGQENGIEGGGKGREIVVSGDKSDWGESWKRETEGRVREGQEMEKRDGIGFNENQEGEGADNGRFYKAIEEWTLRNN